MASPFEDGQGIGASVGNVNSALTVAVSRLTEIDRLLKNIMANGAATPGIFGGGAGGNKGTGGIGAGSNLMASSLGRIATGSPRAAALTGAAQMGLGVASATMGVMPGASQTVPLQWMAYQSAALTGGTVHGQFGAIRASFGNGMSSPSDAAQVGATFANYGIGPGTSSGNRLMGNVAGLYSSLGINNQTALNGVMSLYGKNRNYWSANMFGVQMMNADGSRRGVDQVAYQMYNRLAGMSGGKISRNAILNMNGATRYDVMQMTGGDQQATQMILEQMARISANGGKYTPLDKNSKAPAGSPWTSVGKYNASQYNISTSARGDSTLAGYEKSMENAAAATDYLATRMGALGKVLDGVAYGRGYSEGINGTPYGSAGSSLIGGISGGLATMGMGSVGKSLLGKLVPKAVGADGAPVAAKLVPRVAAGISSIGADLAAGGAATSASIAGPIAGALAAAFGGWESWKEGGKAAHHQQLGWGGKILNSPAGVFMPFFEAIFQGSKLMQGGKGSAPGLNTSSALNFASGQTQGKGSENWSEMCDHFVGRCYGYSASGYASANAHWDAIPAKYKHSGNNPPAGALVFWSVGDFGHVALSVGGGKVASTDIKRQGHVDVVPISLVATKWNARYRGWTDPYFHGKVHKLGKDGGTAVSQAMNTVSSGGVFGSGAQGNGVLGLNGSNMSLSAVIGAVDLSSLLSGGSAASTGGGYTGSGPSAGSSSYGSAGAAAKGGGAYTGSNSSLVSTLKAAGFTGKGLQVAYAVAMAESGGRATDHNNNASTGDDSYGLFQVNLFKSLRGRIQQYGLHGASDLYDPLTNAKVAYKMSAGGHYWAPWSTYKSGAYKKYMTGAAGASEGMWNVSGDQPINAHNGEMILTSEESSEVRAHAAKVKSGQRGGKGSVVNVYVTLNNASDAEALRLARTVQRVLGEDDRIAKIGSS